METIHITGEFIKLDAFLKFAALVGTGGEAKMVIADGMVLVNGEPCTMRGKKLRAGDTVTFADTTLLVEQGWPMEFLDEICTCPKCRDTGTVEDDFGLSGSTAVQEWDRE